MVDARSMKNQIADVYYGQIAYISLHYDVRIYG